MRICKLSSKALCLLSTAEHELCGGVVAFLSSNLDGLHSSPMLPVDGILVIPCTREFINKQTVSRTKHKNNHRNKWELTKLSKYHLSKLSSSTSLPYSHSLMIIQNNRSSKSFFKTHYNFYMYKS